MTVPAWAMPTLALRRCRAPHRVLAWLAWLAVLATFLLTVAPARADGRVAFLSERLKYPPGSGKADDFRVRTNAALALGATDDDDAIAPLCTGLDDPSEVVRQAVAVALKRLGRASAHDCLQRRVAVETNAAVKAQVKRALDALDAAAAPAGGQGREPSTATIVNAKYYVSVSKVTNHTTRAAADVERIVGGAIASKLADIGEYQLAPQGESNTAAKAALTKRKMKGYYLGVSVDKLDYSDGSLHVRVKIAVFSYPDRDLRGEVPAGATLPGARPGDSGAEEQLMSVVAARAAELFAQNFK
jgi:HEAT repeats